MDLFTSDEELEKEMEMDGKEEKMNRAVIGLRSRFGPNAVLRGKNLMEGATGAQRGLLSGYAAVGTAPSLSRSCSRFEKTETFFSICG